MVKESSLEEKLSGVTRTPCEHGAIVDDKSVGRNIEDSVNLLG